MKLFIKKNPTLRYDSFVKASLHDDCSGPMTVQGVVFKTAILLSLLMISAVVSWTLMFHGLSDLVGGIGVFCFMGALMLGFYTVYQPERCNITAPIYAIFEGFLLGSVSFVFEASAHGVVSSSIFITLATLIGMLLLYRKNIIKVNETFLAVMSIAISGIMIVYFFNMIFFLLGIKFALFESNGNVSILFSLFVTVVAALYLVVNFAFINQLIDSGNCTKKAEWYAGFSIMVALIWLYIEILKLISKLNSRRN